MTLALLGIDVGDLVGKVVNNVFRALLDALTPDFLRNADVATLKWLVALPNPAEATAWPTVSHLQGQVVVIAGALLPTMLLVGGMRDTALGFALRAHPGSVVLRFLGAVFWLLMYRWAIGNAVALVNTLTDTMLSWPVVAQGLRRTVTVLFGGSVLLGVGGPFLALLGLVALFLAVALMAMKVLILVVLAILYVAGGLVIAMLPVPELAHLSRAWFIAMVGVCMVPIGWCVIFATAGALSLDVTRGGGFAGGVGIGDKVVGAFATIITFVVALRWPLVMLGALRASLGALTPGGGSAFPSGGGSQLPAKAQAARARLQTAAVAGGRTIGRAAGQLGAPPGGLAGVGVRRMSRATAIAARSVGATGLAERVGTHATPKRRPLGAPRERAERAWRAVRGLPRDVRHAVDGASPSTRTRRPHRRAQRESRVGTRAPARRPAARPPTLPPATPPRTPPKNPSRRKKQR